MLRLFLCLLIFFCFSSIPLIAASGIGPDGVTQIYPDAEGKS